MKVLIIEIPPKVKNKCINKDLSGGMGTKTWVGSSLRAKIFESVKKANVVLPNLTNAYLVSIFKQADWQVKFIELNEKTTFNKSADLALVDTSIVDCQYELEVIKELKKQGLYVGAYGSFASAVPEFFLDDVDFVIKGEAEAGALQIAESKNLPEGILNVEKIDNLDNLPFPDWDQFPINKYSYSPALNKKPVLTILTSRGCPYSCAYYCPYIIQLGRQWRTRSIENVIKEIEYLKDRYSIKAIDFRDMIFTLDKQRTIDLAQAMIKKNLKIIWSCETRLDRLDKELIEIMQQAGLRNLNIGIESYSAEVLKKSQRLPIELKHQEEIISYCHKSGINIAAFYILGLEDDTRETILQTIEYAKKLNTLVAQFTICTPYPGTPFFNQIKKENRLTAKNWQDYDTYNLVFQHINLDKDELHALKEKAFVEYYFRPKYLFKHMPKYIWQKYLWPF